MKKINKILPIIALPVATVSTLPVIASCSKGKTVGEITAIDLKSTATVINYSGVSVVTHFRLSGVKNPLLTKLTCSVDKPTDLTGDVTSANAGGNIVWVDFEDGTFDLKINLVCNPMTTHQTGTFKFKYRVNYEDPNYVAKSADHEFTITVRMA